MATGRGVPQSASAQPRGAEVMSHACLPRRQNNAHMRTAFNTSCEKAKGGVQEFVGLDYLLNLARGSRRRRVPVLFACTRVNKKSARD